MAACKFLRYRRGAGIRGLHGGLRVAMGLEARNGAATQAAWRSKASWYLVAKDDKMIPPDAQLAMSKRKGAAIMDVPGDHSVYIPHAGAVASFLEEATQGAAQGCCDVENCELSLPVNGRLFLMIEPREGTGSLVPEDGQTGS